MHTIFRKVENMASINRYYLLILSLVSMLVLPLATAQTPATSNNAASSVISSSLCGIITTIQDVVGVIALALFILGGAFYAVAHMLPAAGNLKGNLQGWSLGMIVGGIVGLVIVIIAPSVISMITSTSSNIGSLGCT